MIILHHKVHRKFLSHNYFQGLSAITLSKLCCFVYLSSKERGEIARLCCETQSQVDFKSPDILIEWQCVYQDALTLFLLLRCSSQSVPWPSCAFDEKIILSLSSKEQNIDCEVQTVIEVKILLSKYAQLLAILKL